MKNNYDFRIIIVDDNPDIHKDFIKTLTSVLPSSELDAMEEKLFGKELNNTTSTQVDIPLPIFQIDTATQGQQGVEQIYEAIKQGRPYSLAFVDVRMPPGWDGIETIKHIWELDKDIQIVICTAYSDYSWEETIAQLGQSDNLLILKKPFDHIAVRQLAYALTRKWKLMQESRKYTESLEKTVQIRTEELQHQATHDALTALPNRVLLEDRLHQAIAESERNNSHFAILFLDLDRFKLINDSLNHSAGDELLRVVSKRLKANIRGINTLARIGGDEFVMIIKDLAKPEQVTNIAMSLLNVISKPLSVADHTITITASMGICIYPTDGTSMEILIRNADIAMYRAKELGGNQFQFYTSEMNEAGLKALELEADLRQAIINNHLFLCYQPQYSMKTNQIEAVEALVRWNHPTKGVLLPMDFIPLAEETGLIVAIGEWVLREACQQSVLWQEAGLPFIRVAVNVTTQQIRQLNFVETIAKILESTKLSPTYLELELSEKAIINNASAKKVITRLREMGVRIAIDDFGTGYSSLNYLRTMQLDRLKIDQSFVQNMLINQNDEVIIQAIIAMAQGLNLDVLAEGVETQKQLDFLKSTKCKDIQGFYFSHPLSATELVTILKNKSDIHEMLREE